MHAPSCAGGAGLLKLLAQLTVVGDVSRDAFVSRVRDMAAGPEHVLVVLGARRAHASVRTHCIF